MKRILRGVVKLAPLMVVLMVVAVAGVVTGCAFYTQKQVGPGGETRSMGFSIPLFLEPNTVAPAQPARITRTVTTTPMGDAFYSQQPAAPMVQQNQSQLMVPLSPGHVQDMGANTPAPLQYATVNGGGYSVETTVEDYGQAPTNPAWVEHVNQDTGSIVYSDWSGNVMWQWGQDSYGRRVPIVLSCRPERLEFHGYIIARDRGGCWGRFENHNAPHCDGGRFVRPQNCGRGKR